MCSSSASTDSTYCGSNCGWWTLRFRNQQVGRAEGSGLPPRFWARFSMSVPLKILSAGAGPLTEDKILYVRLNPLYCLLGLEKGRNLCQLWLWVGASGRLHTPSLARRGAACTSWGGGASCTCVFGAGAVVPLARGWDRGRGRQRQHRLGSGLEGRSCQLLCCGVTSPETLHSLWPEQVTVINCHLVSNWTLFSQSGLESGVNDPKSRCPLETLDCSRGPGPSVFPLPCCVYFSEVLAFWTEDLNLCVVREPTIQLTFKPSC